MPVFGDHQTGLFQFGIVIGFIFKDRLQTLPSIRRQTQLKFIDGLFRDTTSLEILNGVSIMKKGLMIKIRRLSQIIGECFGSSLTDLGLTIFRNFHP